jgi:hypothetical protein
MTCYKPLTQHNLVVVMTTTISTTHNRQRKLVNDATDDVVCYKALLAPDLTSKPYCSTDELLEPPQDTWIFYINTLQMNATPLDVPQPLDLTRKEARPPQEMYQCSPRPHGTTKE